MLLLHMLVVSWEVHKGGSAVALLASQLGSPMSRAEMILKLLFDSELSTTVRLQARDRLLLEVHKAFVPLQMFRV